MNRYCVEESWRIIFLMDLSGVIDIEWNNRMQYGNLLRFRRVIDLGIVKFSHAYAKILLYEFIRIIFLENCEYNNIMLVIIKQTCKSLQRE